MAYEEIEWVPVRYKLNNKIIGAAGFIGDEVVTVVSFYKDQDPNFDGEVSTSEWLAAKVSFGGVGGMAAARVANAAANQPNIMTRDGNIKRLAGNLTVKKASDQAIKGVYAAYFKGGVGTASGAIANKLTTSKIKSFAIKKGLEKVVKDAMT